MSKEREIDGIKIFVNGEQYEAYKGTLQDQIEKLQERIDKTELKLLRDIEYLTDQKERLMEIITPEIGGLKAELEYKIKEKEELLDILKGEKDD